MHRTVTSVALLLALLVLPHAVQANDKLVRLAVPDRLIESGLLKYMLPRFTLKTQVRFAIVAPGSPADAELGGEGTAVFTGDGQTWNLVTLSPDHPGTQRFFDWITSEVGRRAITGFQRDGVQVFTLPNAEVEEAEVEEFVGNSGAGRTLSRLHCGRCHVAASEDRMNSIGSTPSFFVLRSMENWSERFETFYVLPPHPAFTQIADVTEPFPAHLPSPIVPIEISLDDLDAILAYVSEMEPADLGAPLETQ